MNETGDLAVLAVFFNPGGYKSTVASFPRFHEKLNEQGVRIRAVEVAFGDGPLYVSDLEGVSQVRTPDVLWQFERVISHLISQLPSACTKVAWLDTDILFENAEWPEQLRIICVVEDQEPAATGVEPSVDRFDGLRLVFGVLLRELNQSGDLGEAGNQRQLGVGPGPEDGLAPRTTPAARGRTFRPTGGPWRSPRPGPRGQRTRAR